MEDVQREWRICCVATTATMEDVWRAWKTCSGDRGGVAITEDTQRLWRMCCDDGGCSEYGGCVCVDNGGCVANMADAQRLWRTRRACGGYVVPIEDV